ncbi:hypothetical protein D0S45_17890 [Marinifilum sp. JC120]|nr:hypothetical protein D0S45_17890 [Marinifilum sp. JC120]
MMKLIRAGLMSAVLVVLMCGGVFAQGTFISQGSAFLPEVYSDKYNNLNQGWTMIHLTNVSGSNVHVRIKILNQDGLEVTQFSKYFKGGSSGVVTISSGTGDVDIPAHSALSLKFQAPNPQVVTGYGTIEWSSDDTQLRKGLMGIVKITGWGGNNSRAGEHTYAYQINNGQPF